MKIGILGGGQLGRMLIQNALKYDDEWFTLDPAKDAPCSSISYFTEGNFNDYESVFNFGKGKDVVSIEIEHVNVDALFELQESSKPFSRKSFRRNFIKNIRSQVRNFK